MSSILPQTTLGDPERESNTGDQTESPNPQSKGTVFADSSGPFFTLYSEAAEYEDNKMIKRWQDDAKGILIFVSLFSTFILFHTQTGALDRSFLCRTRCTPYCHRPGPEAKQSRYLRLLSWEHL